MMCIALPSGPGSVDSPAQAQAQVLRNPQRLQAVEVLERRKPGVAAKVHFSWDQVPGARAYVLSGRWTSAASWTVHSREYRVTPRNATTWNARSVAFDVSLVDGAYSWSLVAVHGSHDTGDFENPTVLSFEVR
jgi:hypothetical protein